MVRGSYLIILSNNVQASLELAGAGVVVWQQQQ
jgi:hypothetical protein